MRSDTMPQDVDLAGDDHIPLPHRPNHYGLQ